MLYLKYEVRLEHMKESQIRSGARPLSPFGHTQVYTRVEELQAFFLQYCTNDKVLGYSLDMTLCPEPLG